MAVPHHKPQEIPLDDPCSHYRLRPSPAKPFLATPAAVRAYGERTIEGCHSYLQVLAVLHDGLDYLQVFVVGDGREDLWFVEDDDGGAITALLPSNY